MNEPTEGSPLSALTGSDPLLAGELSAGELACVTEAFRALSDPTRVRLLSMISARNGDACVHELVDGLELSQPTVSHHLKVLREAGLVTSERHASNVYYRVDPWAVSTLGRMLGPQPVVDGGDTEDVTGDASGRTRDAGSRPEA